MAPDWVMPVLQYLGGITGGIAAFVLAAVLYELRHEGALRSFQKDPAVARQDFHHLALAAGVMFASFAMYAIGGYWEYPLLIIVSRIIEIAFFGLMIGLFVRWWRRFK